MNFRIIKFSSFTYLFSTETNQLREVLIHTYTALNLSFKALYGDVYNATKEEVALKRLIKISTQFPVSQGVTWRKQRKFDKRSRFKENVNQEQAMRKI